MTDSQTVRWGIVGPGRIASLVIKDFRTSRVPRRSR